MDSIIPRQPCYGISPGRDNFSSPFPLSRERMRANSSHEQITLS